MPDDEAASDSASIATAEAVREEAEQPESLGDIAGADAARSRIETPNTASVLDAISTQLAPYQPTQASYPLAYRLQIEPDGTIIEAEPIGDNVPAIAVSGETITPAPGRPLTVEIIYTGDNRPVVNELF